MSTLYLKLERLPGGNDISGNAKQYVTSLGNGSCFLPLASNKRQGFISDSKDTGLKKQERGKSEFFHTPSEKNY